MIQVEVVGAEIIMAVEIISHSHPNLGIDQTE
jgi:hypothetical protein